MLATMSQEPPQFWFQYFKTLLVVSHLKYTELGNACIRMDHERLAFFVSLKHCYNKKYIKILPMERKLKAKWKSIIKKKKKKKKIYIYIYIYMIMTIGINN